MRRLLGLLRRVLGTFVTRHRDREFEAEMESHLQLHIDDEMAAGRSPVDARRRALAKLGGLAATRQAWREQRGVPRIDAIRKDIVYALRQLRQSWGWTAVAVLSLGLGIGANVALFAVAHRALAATLAVRDPATLVALHWSGNNPAAVNSSSYGYWAAAPAAQTWAGSFSYAAFDEMRRRTRTLPHLFAFAPVDLRFSSGSVRETLQMQFVSGNYYPALGVRPRLGRLLSNVDDETAASVVVLSEEYWKRRFNGDPAILGSAVSINEHAFSVVGIAPAGLGDLYRPDGRTFDVVLPLSTEPVLVGERSRLRNPADWWLLVMGRRDEGTSLSQIQADLAPVFANAAGAGTKPRADLGPLSLSVSDGRRGVYDVRPEQTQGMTIVGITFAVVLGIVIVNLANLFLFRGETRQREFAMRSTLGASRGRLVQQLLTESLALSVIGMLVGLACAEVCLRLLAGTTGTASPVSLNATALVFAMSLTVCTAICFGLFPAFRSTSALGARIPLSRVTGRRRIARVLVAVQVTLSAALLVSAGLLTRSLINLRSTPSGFNAENLAFVRVRVEMPGYGPERLTSLRRDVLGYARTLPGIESATMSSQTLLTGDSNGSRLEFDGKVAQESTPFVVVGTDYFKTLQIPIRQGRALSPADDAGEEPLAVVTEAFAARWYAGQSPIGRTFRNRYFSPQPIRIIGVSSNIKYARMRADAPPIAFVNEGGGNRSTSVLYVRTVDDPSPVLARIRAFVLAQEPTADVRMSRQTEAIEAGYQAERAFALASSTFGLLAVLVSMVGLFGLLSYAVARRTKEFGVRVALGATPHDLLRSVLVEALTITGLGTLLGIGLSFAASGFLGRYLFELSPYDPVTHGGAVVILFVVATVAGALPAWRASRVEPTMALRHD
jgi:predicted permease